jgi:uncharacterized glyoxalase superfamily protein PhnB
MLRARDAMDRDFAHFRRRSLTLSPVYENAPRPWCRDHRRAVALALRHASSDTEVDGIVHRAEGAGASVIVRPTRQPWGMYAATFADPDGHLWLVTSTPAPGGQ